MTNAWAFSITLPIEISDEAIDALRELGEAIERGKREAWEAYWAALRDTGDGAFDSSVAEVGGQPQADVDAGGAQLQPPTGLPHGDALEVGLQLPEPDSPRPDQQQVG